MSDSHGEHLPVGITEIAERLGVPRPTVDTWRYRDKLPASRWRVGGRPAWCWRCDISPWAERYGKQRAGLA